MRCILVLNAKGGSGKTTIATNLAGYYAVKGVNVALADLDPQRSSLDWLEVRPEGTPEIRALDGIDGHLRVPKGTQVLIVDAPSRAHGNFLEQLVRRAHTIIMPVVPSPVDIRAAMRFLGELSALRKVLAIDVKLAAIGNRVRERSNIASELDDYLDHQRLPDGRKFPYLTMLRQHSNYLRAAERGLSIFEFAPAATEIDREQWRPLLRWLNSPNSVPGNFEG